MWLKEVTKMCIRDRNKLDVQEGRLPEKSGEIFLDSTFASTNEYKVGDKVALREDGDSPLLVTTESVSYTHLDVYKRQT